MKSSDFRPYVCLCVYNKTEAFIPYTSQHYNIYICYTIILIVDYEFVKSRTATQKLRKQQWRYFLVKDI